MITSQMSEKTYANQKKLKSLPVGDLFETAEIYLNSVRPLTTPEEFANTQRLLADFIKPNGVGQQLQQKLLAHAAEEEKKGKSWLETWWLEYGYLR